MRHFEAHLLGRRFLLETDHQALQLLQSKRSPNKRLTRWALFLQEFAFEVRYRPGTRNGNADGLSRQAWEPDEVASV